MVRTPLPVLFDWLFGVFFGVVSLF